MYLSNITYLKGPLCTIHCMRPPQILPSFSVLGYLTWHVLSTCQMNPNLSLSSACNMQLQVICGAVTYLFSFPKWGFFSIVVWTPCGMAYLLPSVLLQKVVKWWIYIVHFHMNMCSKALTMISLPPADQKHNYIGASGSHFKAVHLCYYSFYRPWKDGKLSELLRQKRFPKYSTLDQAGDWTGDLRIGRQRSYHYSNPSAL